MGRWRCRQIRSTEHIAHIVTVFVASTPMDGCHNANITFTHASRFLIWLTSTLHFIHIIPFITGFNTLTHTYKFSLSLSLAPSPSPFFSSLVFLYSSSHTYNCTHLNLDLFIQNRQINMKIMKCLLSLSTSLFLVLSSYFCPYVDEFMNILAWMVV